MKKCELNCECKGCLRTDGRPFGEKCIVAGCCQKGETALKELKENLIAAFQGLHIQDMEEVTDLNALKGSFVNIEYHLPNGETVKFWNDNRIYLGISCIKRTAIGVMGLLPMKNISWYRNTGNMVPTPKLWYLSGGTKEFRGMVLSSLSLGKGYST